MPETDAADTSDDTVGGDEPAIDSPATAAEPVTPPRSRALVPVVIVLGLLVVALAAFASDRSRQLSEAEASIETQSAAEVRQTVGDFATALFTYDYRDDLAATKAKVLSYAYGGFRKEYSESWPGLEQVITKTKARSKATVTAIYLGEPKAEGTIDAVVVVTLEADGAAGRTVSPDTYLELNLTRNEGRWKVGDVTNLTFDRRVAGGGDTEASTTTTR